ncbi:MAG TPA: hypothetical protein VH332_10055 [Nitrospira sp.]|jgi:hypothetical protein
MMRHDDDSVNSLERALIEAYRAQSQVSPPVDVTRDVMRDVRRAATGRSRWTPATVLDQLVWRTATITAAVVLIASVLTVSLWGPSLAPNPVLVAEELESVPLFDE